MWLPFFIYYSIHHGHSTKQRVLDGNLNRNFIVKWTKKFLGIITFSTNDLSFEPSLAYTVVLKPNRCCPGYNNHQVVDPRKWCL